MLALHVSWFLNLSNDLTLNNGLNGSALKSQHIYSHFLQQKVCLEYTEEEFCSFMITLCLCVIFESGVKDHGILVIKKCSATVISCLVTCSLACSCTLSGDL